LQIKTSETRKVTKIREQLNEPQSPSIEFRLRLKSSFPCVWI